jgi:hypothetical protein
MLVTVLVVATFDPLIREEALRQKVDPNLVRAIVFAEAARGHYFGAARAAQGIGAEDLFSDEYKSDDLVRSRPGRSSGTRSQN